MNARYRTYTAHSTGEVQPPAPYAVPPAVQEVPPG
jgi:hypothetical protein